MEDIWAQQVVGEEAQWVVPQDHPGSNGPLHCCGSGHGTRGTGAQGVAGPLLPHSPLDDNLKVKTSMNMKGKTCSIFLL